MCLGFNNTFLKCFFKKLFCTLFLVSASLFHVGMLIVTPNVRFKITFDLTAVLTQKWGKKWLLHIWY